MRDYFKGKSKYLDAQTPTALPTTIAMAGVHGILRQAQSTCYHACRNRETHHPADLEDHLQTIIGRDTLDLVLQHRKWPFFSARSDVTRKAAEQIITLQQDTTGYNKQASKLRIALRSTHPAPITTPRSPHPDWDVEKLEPFELWTITHEDTYIGVYATKHAARRVLSCIVNPKVLSHISAYKQPRADPLPYLLQLHEHDHKLNYPLAAPIERVKINKENKIKLQTPLEVGYTKSYGSRFLAASAKNAMLCAGDLTIFMEQPE